MKEPTFYITEIKSESDEYNVEHEYGENGNTKQILEKVKGTKKFTLTLFCSGFLSDEWIKEHLSKEIKIIAVD
jgi:hypothetical protein